MDCSSCLRSGGGTSLTERYTSVLLPTEMKIVELFKVTRDMAKACSPTQFDTAAGKSERSATERPFPACSNIT